MRARPQSQRRSRELYEQIIDNGLARCHLQGALWRRGAMAQPTSLRPGTRDPPLEPFADDGNFVTANFGRTDGEIAFDPVFRSKMYLWRWIHGCLAISELRAAETERHTSEIRQAWQRGIWNGIVDGTPTKINREGWWDTFTRFAVNLVGPPATDWQGLCRLPCSHASRDDRGCGARAATSNHRPGLRR